MVSKTRRKHGDEGHKKTPHMDSCELFFLHLLVGFKDPLLSYIQVYEVLVIRCTYVF